MTGFDYDLFTIGAGSGGIRAILGLADVQARLASVGLEPAPSTSEELAAIVSAETERWGKVIRAAGIQVE